MAPKRTVLRTGFATVITLSVLSTILAFQMQDSFSQRAVDVHRKYVQQQNALSNLRRILWTASTLARDFFLNTAPDRDQIFVTELRQLEAEKFKSFREVSKLMPQDPGVPQLQARMDDVFALLWRVPASDVADAQQYGFVQDEIVPRREAAAQALRVLEVETETSLNNSEQAFAETRRIAARNLIWILAASVLLALIVSSLSLRHSEVLERQKSAQLQEVSAAKAELEKLSARLMEIQEEERTRLSRELHDEIVQSLALLRIEVTQAQQLGPEQLPLIREHLDRMRPLAERTLQTVRDITLLLRPSLLDDLGLGPALQWLTDDFRRRTKVRCDFVEQDLSEDLPGPVKTCVYRVTQEALHNCEKHAHASSVTVRVVETPGLLCLEVADNGVGLDGGAPARNTLSSTHMGILGMRERAASLGGTLNIEAADGGGFKVILSVPLQITPAAVETIGKEAIA